MAFSIKVNGTTHSADIGGDTPLLWVLRDMLGMTGTQFGRGGALCDARTIHVEGTATRSCIPGRQHQRQRDHHHPGHWSKDRPRVGSSTHVWLAS